ncbi:MAG: two-component regulator propeller domain-containing protein [Bacteroides graminisolvens]|nr:two-component regulator propeller domain-containing protein [Bacteroides graminisolvens]
MKYQILKMIIGLLFWNALILKSESYYFKPYQVEHGLSNNNITSCLQDANGFMWFGTRDGLNRFDGYSFRIFRNDSGKPKSIGNSWVTCMAMDKNNTLWFGSLGGLYRYNEQEETFEPISFTLEKRVVDLVPNQDGDLWMILRNQLVKYNIQLNSHQTFTIPDNSSPTSICMTPQGKLWIGLHNGKLYELDEESGQFINYNLYTDTLNYRSKNISKIYPTISGDKLFIGSATDGAKILDIQTGTYKDILKEEKREIAVRGFIQTSLHEVWIATESGLFIYNIPADSYVAVQKRPYDPYSLTTNSLYCLFQDNDNGIWVGTYSGGINYYSPFQPFKKYYAYPGEDVLKGDLIHDICTDKYNNLWIATEDAGINKLNTTTGKYTNYQPQSGKMSIFHVNIHGLVADDTRLWVGSFGGVEVIDIPTGEVIKHYDKVSTATSWRNNAVVNMKKLPSGKLLVATTNGMFYYNSSSDQFDLMPQFPSQHRIQSIYEDHTGTIWAGTVGSGLFYYNPIDESSGSFIYDTLFTNNSNNTINDIYEDQSYNLWFATFEGLKKYNRKNKQITRYTEKNGMPSNITFRILSDKNENLWISTSNGLAHLNPKTEEIITYKHEHGLITNQFNYNSAWKDKTGRMYFGMVKGMISFHPEEIKINEKKVKVYFTEMTIFDKTSEANIPSRSISSSKDIELEHDQSTFSISFSTLSYIAPDITEYAFFMEGLNKNWTYLNNSHTAYYTKLPPGHYIFKVKAANISGIWNDDNIATLNIIIKQPWWFSNFAQFVYYILFIGLCLLIIHMIKNRNKKRLQLSMRDFEVEKEKELYQAKIQFFINISHEIRTPLTLIKSPLDKVLKNKDIPEEARDSLDIVNKNANRLLDLVNQLLDFRKTEIKEYNLSFTKTDIVIFIDAICERFRDTVEEHALLFNIKSDTKHLYAFIDKEVVTKVISNLLTNAIKYARSYISVSIVFLNEEDTFTISVSNDGEQIPEEIKEKIFDPFFRGESAMHKPGTGLGLPLAKSLTEMHRGTLSLVETSNELITFRLYLPINQPNPIQLSEEKPLLSVSTKKKTFETDKSRATILIVEDNTEMQRFVGHEINTLYNVVTANNGQEALIVLKEQSIKLIVSDIMMPIMDGFSLLKKVKTDLEFSHIPVILLTAKNTIQARLEGLELGADAYIEKPFSMDLLLAQITNLLNNRNSVRSYYSTTPLASMKSMACTKADENFLEKLNDIINKHMEDINLDVDMIADQMSLSRPTLYRKISALSNLTPNELINISRLKKAAELILQGDMRIYEIAETVGFNSHSYFSRAFSKQFNMSPSQYAKSNNIEID